MRRRWVFRNGWRPEHAVAAAGVTGVALWATADAWRDLARLALRDPEASHLCLVLPVAAWLAWVRRGRWRACRPGGGLWIGPPVLALGWLCWSVGYHQALQALWHLGAVLTVLGAFLSVAGWSVLRSFGPALAALLFLVPLPPLLREQVALPLQAAMASSAQWVFEVLGLPVQRWGNVLTVNGTDVAITQACNGIRMGLGLTLVCYACAFGLPLRGPVRALMLLATPVSVVLCNGLRMLLSVGLYGYASAPVAKLFHDASGWLMVLLAFLMLAALVRLLRWAMVPIRRYTLAWD